MATTFITENLSECINITTPKGTAVPYTVFTLSNKYDVDNDDINMRFYRSAIMADGKLLCMAPSKSLSNAQFASVVGENPRTKTEEIVEGTMINLFWDERVGWEIATKKSIGGNYFYFRNQYDGAAAAEQKTFRQMFLDAFGVTALVDIKMLDILDKSCSYTFVLQHPLNHIVLNIERPVVYLVHIYKFTGMDYQYCDEQNPELLNHGVQFPAIVDSNADGPGHMTTDLNTGLRTVFKNPAYEDLKTLRGNNPNLFFQYLMLRKTDDVDRFLKHFPQYNNLFQTFQDKFTAFVSNVYRLYVDAHILKTVDIKSVEDKQLRFFVEKIHYTVYLPSLKTNKVKISPKVVEAFFDGNDYMMPV
jgi:hypothetical protein